jgi:cysteinyl-tRNA synthetase
MSTISTLTDVQDKVLEAVTSTQEPVVNFVKKVVELAESRVPELKLSLNDNLPQIHEVVELEFAFAEKLLKNQHAFANDLVAAVKPVTEKVVDTKAAPAKPKAPKAA